MKKVLLVITIIFLCTGCLLDPYKNEDDAVSAVNAWFTYKNDKDDLGKTRKKQEQINTINDIKCQYVEKDDYLRYVYKCKITYTPSGKTIIPLAKDEEISVYTVLSYNDDRTYEYIVYNSKSKDKIWLEDDELNYGKPKEKQTKNNN